MGNIAAVALISVVGKRIVMLHSFVKKSKRTPPRDREIAEIRMKEIKYANTRGHGAARRRRSRD